MLKPKETTLLSHLRQNSRKSLKRISKETNIPVSTLFETLRKLEKNYIERHVTLIDFGKTGHNIRTSFVISANNKDKMRIFLQKHNNINSLYKTTNGADFIAEGIFKDLKQMHDFKDELENIGAIDIQENHIIDEIKREGFEFM